MNATSDPALRRLLWIRGLWYSVVALAGCLVDLFTKHWMVQWMGLMSGDRVWWLWEDYIGIQTHLNPGAVFGSFAGWGSYFAVLSIGAFVGIVVWLFVFQAARSAWTTAALALITGGILGNLYDRLGLWVTPGVPTAYHTCVRDWILFRAGSEAWSWPNFNIADSLLVIGAAMLLWQGYVDPPVHESGEPQATGN